MTKKTRCRSCGGNDLEPFYEQRNVPVNDSLLMPTRAEAIGFPRADLRLALCRRCGFIQNVLFDASRLEYASREETAQTPPSRQHAYEDELVRRLVETYDLHGKSILEIGGGGEFLFNLVRAGANRGVAVDPSYAPDQTPADVAASVEFVQDLYSERYLQLRADFVACRQTLQRIQPVSDFVSYVRKHIGDRREPVVFFEVPDAVRVLKELAFWDVCYEHCSYFSLGSLARLFRAGEFEIFSLTTDYEDQRLLIECAAGNIEKSDAAPTWQAEDDMAELQRLTKYFGEHHEAKRREWQKTLQQTHRQGSRAVLWGSGSEAVSFLTGLGLTDEIEYVIDADTSRQGGYVIGGGQEVVAPEFLQEYAPDLVVAMNHVHLPEIASELSRLSVKTHLTSV
jgi:hypothetical protein